MSEGCLAGSGIGGFLLGVLRDQIFFNSKHFWTQILKRKSLDSNTFKPKSFLYTNLFLTRFFSDLKFSCCTKNYFGLTIFLTLNCYGPQYLFHFGPQLCFGPTFFYTQKTFTLFFYIRTKFIRTLC